MTGSTPDQVISAVQASPPSGVASTGNRRRRQYEDRHQFDGTHLLPRGRAPGARKPHDRGDRNGTVKRQHGCDGPNPEAQDARWTSLYLASMTGRVGAKGQVVIPKAIRDRAQLHPGDEVEFELRDDQVVIVARRDGVRLGGRFASSGMAGRLLEDRAREPR